METQFNIRVPHDFEIICVVFTCNTADVLQDYINRISLPRLISGHPDDPSGSDMQLILHKTQNQDPKKIDKKIVSFLKKNYQKELQDVLKLKLEQPECEAMIRQVLKKWYPKVVELRKELREKFGLNFNIVGHDN